MKSRTIQLLTKLLHRRWSVPVMAELCGSSGAKFITLVNRLGVSRDSLNQTLRALIERGWVLRNPGHGHPLRPEYVLTRKGVRVGRWCVRIMKVLSALGVEDVGLRKWSIPVALAIRSGRERFSELRSFLPEVTARALTHTLKELQHAGLIDRAVTDGYPPQTRYRLTTSGTRLSGVLIEFY